MTKAKSSTSVYVVSINWYTIWGYTENPPANGDTVIAVFDNRPAAEKAICLFRKKYQKDIYPFLGGTLETGTLEEVLRLHREELQTEASSPFGKEFFDLYREEFGKDIIETVDDVADVGKIEEFQVIGAGSSKPKEVALCIEETKKKRKRIIDPDDEEEEEKREIVGTVKAVYANPSEAEEKKQGNETVLTLNVRTEANVVTICRVYIDFDGNEYDKSSWQSWNILPWESNPWGSDEDQNGHDFVYVINEVRFNGKSTRLVAAKVSGGYDRAVAMARAKLAEIKQKESEISTN